mgnify:FL=1
MLGALALVAIGGAVLGLGAAHARHERSLRPIWTSLARPGPGERFDPAMVDSLPEPARRFLLHAIAPGTPLARAAELHMTGAIQLRPDAPPIPMDARQVLAPRVGYIWQARVASGPMRIRGYDLFTGADGEMRWWVYGLVPVVNATGAELARSANGRAGGENVFVPSLLLPRAGAAWEAVDDSTARVRVPAPIEPVTITITVADDGRVRAVSFPRWNNDPANGPVGYTTFGIDSVTEERTFGGYTIPARFRAGWRLGQPDERAFFFPVIDEVTYH